MYISDTIFKSWMKGDLTRVEGLLTEEIVLSSNPLYHAQALAYRALVRSRSKQWIWRGRRVGSTVSLLEIDRNKDGGSQFVNRMIETTGSIPESDAM